MHDLKYKLRMFKIKHDKLVILIELMVTIAISLSLAYLFFLATIGV